MNDVRHEVAERAWLSRIRWIAAFGFATIVACFDAADATKGLPCTVDSHCGGNLRCIAQVCGEPGEDGVTLTAGECDTTAGDDAGGVCTPIGQLCDGVTPCCGGQACAFDPNVAAMVCQCV